MTSLVIDLNADLGESPEALANGSDFELMRHVTSINVACGGHAGDTNSMRQTVEAAKRLKVAVGAHPSYPDRANFGRVELPVPVTELERTVGEQIQALKQIVESLGVPLVHVKPHGALYHAANHSSEIAKALGRAVMAVDPKLIMVGQAGSAALDVWRGMGLKCAAEAFADRAYEADGSLRPRTLPGALLESPERAAQQALDIVLRHRVIAYDGSELAVKADTLCLHSDTPGAARLASAVARQLNLAGIQLRSLRFMVSGGVSIT